MENVFVLKEHKYEKIGCEVAFTIFRNETYGICAAIISCDVRNRTPTNLFFVRFETGELIAKVAHIEHWKTNVIYDFPKLGCLVSEYENEPYLVDYNDNFRLDLTIAGEYLCSNYKSLFCVSGKSLLVFKKFEERIYDVGSDFPNNNDEEELSVLFMVDVSRHQKPVEMLLKGNISIVFSDPEFRQNLVIIGFANAEYQNTSSLAVIDTSSSSEPKILKYVEYGNHTINQIFYDYETSDICVFGPWKVGVFDPEEEEDTSMLYYVDVMEGVDTKFPMLELFYKNEKMILGFHSHFIHSRSKLRVWNGGKWEDVDSLPLRKSFTTTTTTTTEIVGILSLSKENCFLVRDRGKSLYLNNLNKQDNNNRILHVVNESYRKKYCSEELDLKERKEFVFFRFSEFMCDSILVRFTKNGISFSVCILLVLLN